MVLHPFKVGDFVTVAGVTSTIKEIGLFVTSINTPGNILSMVGNAKIFGDTIQNYTVNDFRRVELKCQLAGSADLVAAMQILREKLAAVPNVLAQPQVEVEILEFTLVGPVLAVRPFCHNYNYWLLAGLFRRQPYYPRGSYGSRVPGAYAYPDGRGTKTG